MSLGAILAALGSLCWRRPRSVLLAWLAVALVASFTAPTLTARLLTGAGDIEGSASLRVDETLRTQFSSADAQSLILAFRSPGLERDPAELSGLLHRLKDLLAAQPSVAAAADEREILEDRLLPKGGTGHFILIDLKTQDVLATEQEVPKIRAALAPVLEAARHRHADLEWAVTGRAALTHDLNRFNAEDAARSEIRALPFTIAILIFAFGSLVASLLPLFLALVTRTVALGIVWVFAGSFEVSNLVLSIVTMLAVALGIDYSLFLLHRYRRELAAGAATGPAADGELAREAAMQVAMTRSGAAVLYSGVTVAIGMGALLATPLMQTRSIGLGGVLAVLVALLVSLTLVPAIVRLLPPRILEWPHILSSRLSGERSRRLWDRWAHVVLRRPLACIAVSLAILLTMAAPALQTRFGFPESEFLPPDLEYSRGLGMLGDMGLKGLVSPVEIVLSDPDAGAALTPDRAALLGDFVARLETDARVHAVLGPVPSSAISADASSFEAAMGDALARNALISDDRTRLLFRVIPAAGVDLADLQDLSARIPAMVRVDGLIAEVGGQAQYVNDFDDAVARSYPLTIGLVLGFSALVLLLFFKAPLASAKAILLNLLSVAAGYGVVVFVFQLGHGADFFGLAGGTGVVPITVPLVIFCVLFGLSMDYEIFLLSRVRTLFMEGGDTARSVREALADTGSVITSAALVMVAVFGAFAFARVFIVQMMGLGLAVAVLVDATLIRSVLGPALMQVAGRWNWWPVAGARSAGGSAQELTDLNPPLTSCSVPPPDAARKP